MTADVPDDSNAATLRVLDAAANRAREGLRVAEDFVRFVLDDAHLTGQLKRLRHDLAATLSRLPAGQLLASRDTQADVGTELSTDAESTRPDAAAVVTANFKRLQESLRTLEEFGKTLDPACAAQLEQIRYRTYTLERAIDTTRASNARLADARLYVLLDGRESLEACAKLASQLIEAGVHVLQLRDKTLGERELLQRARRLRELTRGSGTLLILNDRPDLALLADANGVHVGQEELPVKDVRRVVGPDKLIGVSTHSIEQARQAVLDGANYLGLGPTFASGTKHFDEFPGLEFLHQAAAEIRLPAFAIGGITPDNVSQVLATGIRRVAVSGGILNAPQPADAAASLLERLA